MYILDSVVKTCSDPALGNILIIIKRVVNLIQLFGPLVALVSLILILIKLMSNPENNKLKGAFKNWVIALLMLFFIPMIVNATMKLLDDNFTVSACWNYATSSDKESTYIKDGKEKPSSIITNPDDYEINKSS